MKEKKKMETWKGNGDDLNLCHTLGALRNLEYGFLDNREECLLGTWISFRELPGCYYFKSLDLLQGIGINMKPKFVYFYDQGPSDLTECLAANKLWHQKLPFLPRGSSNDRWSLLEIWALETLHWYLQYYLSSGNGVEFRYACGGETRDSS